MFNKEELKILDLLLQKEIDSFDDVDLGFLENFKKNVKNLKMKVEWLINEK
jgi:hypothetical protein